MESVSLSAAERPALLHEYFERAARNWPDRVAIEVPPGIDRNERVTVTFKQLDEVASSIAAYLSAYVKAECIVAILLPRTSFHLYACQVGVLKSGAAYTCIDPNFPDEQLREILKDSEAVVLLTNSQGIERARQLGYDNAFDVTGDLPSELTLAAPAWLNDRNLAYIIYTSGTTGRPKGVMIEHRSISTLIEGNLEFFALTAADRVGQNSSSAYDSSVEEIWISLSAGSTLVVMDDDTVRLGPDLLDWMRRERITVFCPPPTLLRATGCDEPDKELPDLRLLYVGGEALPSDVADKWAKGKRLINGYGPTECTVTCTRTDIPIGGPISIGFPMLGFEAWALDEHLNEVPDGENGELCMGGIGLARGYYKRPDLTAEKFIEHPRLGRIYRTGDLVSKAEDGSFLYHGRIDAQVKLRGYRIELEAIEARLTEAPGVRSAACRVQEDGNQQNLVAFIVPEDGANIPSSDELKSFLRQVLPVYMVPARIVEIDSIPVSVSGKLNRKALPHVDLQRRTSTPGRQPRNAMEAFLAKSFQETLNLPDEVNLSDDFFNELGGSSLQAAVLISKLRKNPDTALLTVRDLYQARNVEELSKIALSLASTSSVITDSADKQTAHPFFASVFQFLWLVFGLFVGSMATWFVAFEAIPWIVERTGFLPFLALSPVFVIVGGLLYIPASVAILLTVKKVFIGRYRPLRAPVWGSYYVRHWIVQTTSYIVPWYLIEGTSFYPMILRVLGARVGKRVHIHRGVNLRLGGWDLLEIGDEATISQEASVRLVDLIDREIVVASASIGAGATLDIRAGIGGNTVVEPGSFLTPLSFLEDGDRIPAGELWDGIPAKRIGLAPEPPEIPGRKAPMSEFGQASIQVLAITVWALLMSLPFELPIIVTAFMSGVGTEKALAWLETPTINLESLLVLALLVVVPLPFALLLEGAAIRLLGKVTPGVIDRWSPAYIRVWMKSFVVNNASEWLSGTLFWPIWLRLAGMKIGRGCEISTIIDIVPELISIGETTFFADGIYLGGPRIQKGTVTVSTTSLGSNTFLGNHAVILAGHHLPSDILLGVCTVSDDKIIREGSSWFGQPPFELPKREIVECDRSLTHEPSFIRYWNRVFWEALRFALPAVYVVALAIWYEGTNRLEPQMSPTAFVLLGMPLLNLAMPVFLCLFVLLLKWFLLGKVKPGIHPLWSCWCSRWDFLFVAWGVLGYASLSVLQGTVFLIWYLRAMGMKIGKGVVMGEGFAQVVDPDMLHFEDGSTVTCQFQAHTFEDRVLKIDHVIIGPRSNVGHTAVLLYGADIGEGAYVVPHSVVMKKEHLLPGRKYAGSPTRPV